MFGTSTGSGTVNFGNASKPVFSFGSSATTSKPFTGFSSTPTFGTSGFGGASCFSAPATTNMFGASTAPSSSAVGFGFGSTPFGIGKSQASNTFGFGTGNTALQSGFGQTAGFIGQNSLATAPTQPQFSNNPIDNLCNAVLHCCIFGDERDNVIARWNMLQACWGYGRAFLNLNSTALNLTPENPLCRFKAVGYTRLPSGRNEDGLVSFTLTGKRTFETGEQLSTALHSLFGSRPNLKIMVESVQVLSDDRSEIVIYVVETNGQIRRTVPTSDVVSFVTQPANMTKLGSEVLAVTPRVAFSTQEIETYLASAPSGVDPRLWHQAQLDNPDAERLLPVPLIGFRSLQQRLSCQNAQAKAHQARLDVIAEEVSDLQKRHQVSLSKLNEFKRCQIVVAHRVLKVLAKQEATRKLGCTIRPEEEKLRVRLEALHSELSAPTQYKGRLNELLSQIRLQSNPPAVKIGASLSNTVDPFLQRDIASLLAQQQSGLMALVSFIKEDLADLNKIYELSINA